MALTTFNGMLSRAAAGYGMSQPAWSEQTATTTNGIFNGPVLSMQKGPESKAMPSPLPTGVTAYIPTRYCMLSFNSGDCSLLIAKLVDLGSLDISGPTFTDGSSMPTITECGVSRVTSSAVIAEVTTAFSATPGSYTITYVDQDGNAAETTSSVALTGSALVGSCSPVALNTGDTGVRDITAATRTGGTTPTGVMKFWGVIPLTILPMPAGTANSASAWMSQDLVQGAFNPYRLGAGDIVGGIYLDSTAVRASIFEGFYIGED